MAKKERRCKHPLLRIFGTLLAAVLAAAILFLGFLTVTEWKPADTEAVTITGAGESILDAAEPITLLTWNTGYAGLDETQDCFLDGGKRVRAASEDTVRQNAQAIADVIVAQNPDIVLLQEVDCNSDRSYRVDQGSKYSEIFGKAETSAYARNYYTPFVPYPLPPIGKVDCGLFTLSRAAMTEATRYQLPISFTWPVRMVNLKRCLLVTRFDLQGTGKELVVVNLHLEAYAPKEAKSAQTAILKQVLEEEYAKGNYVIAGGDWNMTLYGVDPALYPIVDDSYYVAEQMEKDETPAGWPLLFDESTPTCRLLNKPYDPTDPATQYYVIDGFVISPNLDVLKVQTLDLGFAHSDHNPVALTVVCIETPR